MWKSLSLNWSQYYVTFDIKGVLVKMRRTFEAIGPKLLSFWDFYTKDAKIYIRFPFFWGMLLSCEPNISWDTNKRVKYHLFNFSQFCKKIFSLKISFKHEAKEPKVLSFPDFYTKNSKNYIYIFFEVYNFFMDKIFSGLQRKWWEIIFWTPKTEWIGSWNCKYHV